MNDYQEKINDYETCSYILRNERKWLKIYAIIIFCLLGLLIIVIARCKSQISTLCRAIFCLRRRLIMEEAKPIFVKHGNLQHELMNII